MARDVRGMCRVSPSLCVLALTLVLENRRAALASGAATPGSARPGTRGCDLEPWLQEEPDTDRGYHVLCLQAGHVEIIVDGVAGGRRLGLTLSSDFASELETKLNLSDVYIFHPFESSAWKEKRECRWRKQSWALFGPDGARYDASSVAQQLDATGYEGVLLLFEGGVWRWPAIRRGYERPVSDTVTLKTVSMKPALFELVFTAARAGEAPARGESGQQQRHSHGLSPGLLAGVMRTASSKLTRSLTENSPSKVRTSDTAWLTYASTPGLAELRASTARLLRIPEAYFEPSLQVLRYMNGQLYDAHRDYWDPREFPDESRFLHGSSRLWYMRHATVLWYLKTADRGGETWFPRAHGGPVPVNDWLACDGRGVKLSGRNGTVAILFYNLHSNGEVDEFSWHCACKVQDGEKWAANSWIWNQPQKPPFAVARNPSSNMESTCSPNVVRKMSFRNMLRGEEAQVLWVHEGREEPLFTLQPGGEQSVDTFAGHVFRVRSPSLFREYVVHREDVLQVAELREEEL